MAYTTIRFRIRPDGRVEELVEGIQGEACQALTEGIEDRLGTVQQRQATSEAFITQPSELAESQTISTPLF